MTAAMQPVRTIYHYITVQAGWPVLCKNPFKIRFANGIFALLNHFLTVFAGNALQKPVRTIYHYTPFFLK